MNFAAVKRSSASALHESSSSSPTWARLTFTSPGRWAAFWCLFLPSVFGMAAPPLYLRQWHIRSLHDRVVTQQADSALAMKNRMISSQMLKNAQLLHQWHRQVARWHEQAAFGGALRRQPLELLGQLVRRDRPSSASCQARPIQPHPRPSRGRIRAGSAGCRQRANRPGAGWPPAPAPRIPYCGSRHRPSPDARGRGHRAALRGASRTGARNPYSWCRWIRSGRTRSARYGTPADADRPPPPACRHRSREPARSPARH